jgi:hypothetical protein
MKNITKILVLLSVLGLIALAPTVSYADRNHDDNRHSNHHNYRYHDRPNFGLRVSFLPDNFFTVSLGRSRYYYSDGLYYNRAGSNYIIVRPPVGAVVRALPVEYRPVTINGMTYYVDNGTYYIYTRNGYQVVPQPVPVVQAAPVIVNASPATTYSDDAYTVNIPNYRGGYTAVAIKRLGQGFVGPQGEFYNDFPRVEQLKVMYLR